MILELSARVFAILPSSRRAVSSNGTRDIKSTDTTLNDIVEAIGWLRIESVYFD